MFNNSFVKRFIDKFENSNYLIILLLVGFTIIIRFITLQIIEDSGDQFYYWASAKSLYYGLKIYVFDNWSSRFGIVLPVLFFQKLFGLHPLNYYSAPIFMSILQTIFLYKTAEMAHNRNTAIFATILMIIYPQMLRNGCQILPGIFSATYVIIAFFFLFKFIDAKKNKIIFLILSALFMFIAYESKITNLFFLPGFFITIYLYNKNFKHLFIFAFILLFLFFIETALYSMLTEFTFGRLDVITSNHFQKINSKAVSIFGLFYRYIRPGPHFTLAFIYYLFASHFILKNKYDIKIKGIVFASLSFFFLLTFSLRSIYPIKLAINSHFRYFVAVQPMMFFVISFFTVERFYVKNKNVLNKVFAGFLITCVVLYSIVFRNNFINHPISCLIEYDLLIDTALKNGTPLFYGKKDVRAWHLKKEIRKLLKEKNNKDIVLKKFNLTEDEYSHISNKYKQIVKNFRLINQIFCDNCASGDNRNLYQLKVVDELIFDSKKTLFLMDKKFKKDFDSNSKFVNLKDKVLLLKRRPIVVKKVKSREIFY